MLTSMLRGAITEGIKTVQIVRLDTRWMAKCQVDGDIRNAPFRSRHELNNDVEVQIRGSGEDRGRVLADARKDRSTSLRLKKELFTQDYHQRGRVSAVFLV